MADAKPAAPSPVNFETTPEEDTLIRDIADRFLQLTGHHDAPHMRLNIRMDITAVHLNHMALDLDALLNASDFAFVHDIDGIGRHIDRDTGRLACRSDGSLIEDAQDGAIFVPRCARKEA
jgi:hypothetical protein